MTPLEQTGMVLGPSEASTYRRGYRRLDRGDAVLLYTDGMVEAHDDDGVEFGVGRLTRAFLENRELPCDEIARNLVQRVREYTGDAMPEDDQTVVVVRRGEDPPPQEKGSARQTTGSMPIPIS